MVPRRAGGVHEGAGPQKLVMFRVRSLHPIPAKAALKKP
jgi:hypothetical protein